MFTCYLETHWGLHGLTELVLCIRLVCKIFYLINFLAEVNNLLINGGFEYDVNILNMTQTQSILNANGTGASLGWFNYNVPVGGSGGYGYSLVNNPTCSHSGLRSAKINISNGQSVWIQQEISNLNFNVSLPVLVSAWSKATNVTIDLVNNEVVRCCFAQIVAQYSLFLDVDYALNGVIVNSTTLIAPFSRGTHEWQLRQILVPANTPAIIARINVNLMLRSTYTSVSGIAYFDDISAYYVDSNIFTTVNI